MFALNKESVRLVNVNPRNEKHGDEDVLACDISLEAKLHNSVLLKFSPTLRDALYTKDAGAQEDMINPDHAPTLRNPQMGKINWALELKNVRFAVYADGTNDEEIVFAETKCKKFSLVCQEGGTVIVSFQIQVSQPDEGHVTKLLFLLNKMLKVDVEAGDQTEPDESEKPPEPQAQFGKDAAPDLLTGAGQGDGAAGADAAGAGAPLGETGDADAYDALYDRAKALTTSHNRISIRNVKKELKVSDLVAKRLLDQMQEEGLVGDEAPNGTREVLTATTA